MSFVPFDSKNKRHQKLLSSVVMMTGITLDKASNLRIDEEKKTIVTRDYARHLKYSFISEEDKVYVVLFDYDTQKKMIRTYLKEKKPDEYKKRISSKKGKAKMSSSLRNILIGISGAAILSVGAGAIIDSFPKKPRVETSSEYSGEDEKTFETIVKEEDIPIVEPITIEIEQETIPQIEPIVVENFATIQSGERREGAKYFSYEGTTTGRNLLKARNTTEFMGKEITKWSTYFGLDPKFVMALFSMERPWLPMDNDLVDESYFPVHMGEGKELNIAQITTGAAGVYTVPTFDGEKFLGFKTYDLGTGSGKGEHISIAEAKNNRSLSIEAGCMLLAYHMTKYQGNAIYAALAYNTGENHVNTQISEESFFRDGNSSTLDDKTYAKDLVRYMLNQGITNCNFMYIDKETGEVKKSMYDFDTTNRKYQYKEMNLYASTEIPRLSSETFNQYLAKNGKMVEYSAPSETIPDLVSLVDDEYKMVP